jgi:hypothetical protein
MVGNWLGLKSRKQDAKHGNANGRKNISFFGKIVVDDVIQSVIFKAL